MEENKQPKKPASTGKMPQSAKQKKEKNAGTKAPRTPEQKKALHRRIWIGIGTVFLVMILSASMFVGIFMMYVNTKLKGHVEIDLSEYTQEVSTELYYRNPDYDPDKPDTSKKADKDKAKNKKSDKAKSKEKSKTQDADNPEWIMYQTLFANENRIWVDSEDIPKNLKRATVAIEDKRFYEHKGVDWKGTLRAILSTVSGDGVQGGSTITQQLIKNRTGNNENTVKRKVVEIYRALALEEDLTKDEILTIYLNTIYLGNQCYGVKTAADMYFGKDVSDLTLAECASLISITNNPSQYDPLRADWCREENRKRQVLVLDAMLDQGMISQKTHDKAVNEEVVFTDGWTNMGNHVKPPHSGNSQDVISTANNSYFTDQVISDVADSLVELYGLEDDPADPDGYVRTAYEKAVEMVYSKGLKIYTTQNIDFQETAEHVFENTDYASNTDSNGEPLQAGITLMDPYSGDVLALVGGTGAKKYDRSWNWATAVRQCGSAIKPISTYAPALDDGTITAASSIDDYPIYLPGYGIYPGNSYGTFDGLSTVQDMIKYSSNCAAVRVNAAYGTAASYNFMTDNLGFTTLTPTDAEQVGNMALGGLEEGVTTEEMAAAFSAFVNDGIYTKPRTFVRVEDSEGQMLIDNKAESHVAMKDTTAYLMRQMLETVVASGTGTEADFSGMTTAGKTGTTDSNRDRYFVGFTPYYCAAVWCGYKSNEVIDSWGNPSANLWRQVMSKIHEDLPNKDFHDCSGLVRVEVCEDSGMLAGPNCNKDIRGHRTRTVLVAADTAPTEVCTMHKMISYCTKGKHEATDLCPKKYVKQVAVLDYDRDFVSHDGGGSFGGRVKAKDDAYLLQTLSHGKCPAHKTKPVIPLPDLPKPGPGQKPADKPDVENLVPEIIPPTPEKPDTGKKPGLWEDLWD